MGYEREDGMAVNGFSYDDISKKITVTDGHSIVVWENVERNVAKEAAAMNERSEPIDSFLLENGCKRYWGNK
jgi:hypothetical protein